MSTRTKLVTAFFVWNSFCTTVCSAFFPSAPTNWLDRIFSPPNNDKTNRTRLKQQLLQICQKPNVQRSAIESCIEQLEPLSPVQATAASPLLQKKWMLQWTTEKEINFFLEKGISPPGSIYQVIDGTVLENSIPFFGQGGSFGVKGELSIPNPVGTRTDFVFSEATLDVGRWGVYRFPPVGKGWFDTIYLDDGLRIDINSRNDILICTPELL